MPPFPCVTSLNPGLLSLLESAPPFFCVTGSDPGSLFLLDSTLAALLTLRRLTARQAFLELRSHFREVQDRYSLTSLYQHGRLSAIRPRVIGRRLKKVSSVQFWE